MKHAGKTKISPWGPVTPNRFVPRRFGSVGEYGYDQRDGRALVFNDQWGWIPCNKGRAWQYDLRKRITERLKKQGLL